MDDPQFLEFRDFSIVWIAPLPIERRAALCMFDEVYTKNFRTQQGDDYQFIGGVVQGHKVLLATFPSGTQYGGNSAAALASQVKKCVPHMWLGFLVGIAAGQPDFPSSDIRLGDVLAPLPDSATSGVIQYDFGKQTSDGFLNKSRLQLTESVLRAAIDRMQTLAEDSGQHPFLRHLEREKVCDAKSSSTGLPLFAYPGQQKDKFYRKISDESGNDEEMLVDRPLRDEASQTRVWHGRLGSGNTLMKSSKERDKFQKDYQIIGLEMEAHGVANVLPVANIRGVCDYADEHKNDDWQPYAAIVAAAYAREVLRNFSPSVEPTEQGPRTEIKRFDTMHLPRNKALVSRPDLMKRLVDLLPQDGEPHRGAIYGLGGMGKTQLALEFAYRRRDETKCSLFWVVASTEAQFIAGYTKIAKEAGLASDLKEIDLLNSVCEWLTRQKNWLLILDNADSAELFTDALAVGGADGTSGLLREPLQKYVPQTSAGSVLWTTRDGKIASSLVGRDELINVGKMTEEEALKLLRGHTAASNGDEIKEASDDERTLLGPKILDALPLAISQARAFMTMDIGTSISEYLEFYRESALETLNEASPDIYRDSRERHEALPSSVLHTFTISMNRLIAETPNGWISGTILKTVAFFDNQGIPHEFLEESAFTTRDDGTRSSPSKLQMNRILGRLGQYSFLQEQVGSSEARSYTQHPLLQHAIQFSLSDSKRQIFSTVSRDIVQTLFPDPKVENWGTCKRYLQHCLKISAISTTDEIGVPLLRHLGIYHYQQGLYLKAKEFLSEAVDLGENTVGRRDRDTITTVHWLAVLYSDQGMLNDAEQLQQEVLEFSREVLGEQHSDTISAMNNLALTWKAQGQYSKAEPLQVQILDLRKKVLGEQHPNTISAINNLVLTWQAQRQYSKAEPLQVQVLDLRKKVLGEQHPDTISAMNNLASTWQAQRQYSKAEPLQVQVLDLWKKVLGDQHPDTILAMHNLASIWQAQGQYSKAELLRIQVLDLWKKVLGEQHPDTILAMSNLSSSWYVQRRYIEAEKLLSLALQLRKQIGIKHRDTVIIMEKLAAAWDAQGRTEEAQVLRDQALELKQELENM